MKTTQVLLGLLIGLQIHAIAQDMEATESTALLNVIVTSDDGVSHANQNITFSGLKTEKDYSGTTDPKGLFSILIPEGDNYQVRYEYFGTELDYTTIGIPDTAGIITFDFNIILESPKVITLDNVFFDIGKSTLQSTSFEALDNLVTALVSKPEMEIEIAGHTDNVGDEAANLKLSQSRAESVRTYLLTKQIDGARVVAKGYGPSMPIADNATSKGRTKNRRTEVKIIK
ncbi:MAG: OmpA family protein [Flavobacteriales bacterium]|nr:OmpA family protein [Flavobacteriales bacterium]